MATRQYEFINGPTTSELPSIGTPTGTTDLISLGYADENYMQGGSAKSTLNDLRDVAASARSDMDVRYNFAKDWLYRFEAAATGTDDGDLIIQPTAGSGRWKKILQNLGSNFLGQTDSQNVTNKTVSGSVLLEDVYFKSSSGTNRKVGVSASGATNSTQTTMKFVQTADRTVTFPDASDTLMGKATTDDMTNKILSSTAIMEAVYFLSASGTNRKVKMDVSGATNTTTTTMTFVQTANRAITFQDADHVVVGRNTTDVLSNKTVLQGVIDDYIDVNEETEPSSPSSGKIRIFGKADKKVYKKTSDGVVSEVGSGGGGGINYASSNPDFEGNAVTGWATYADAAATTPVDGTGGSPNSTFASTSSSPLRGTYSGLFTKGAANRQGEGFSFDFSIAPSDKSRPIAISWEGEASANYTGSTGSEYMVCYVYDVTNSTLIATSTVNVPVGSTKGYTTFLATTSTSYRLIFHVAGTGTSAWTYKIDTVSISPYLTVQGAAIDDWRLNTGFTINGFGTVANTKFYTRRSGDSLQVIGFFEAGTAAASTASITLPTGLTIDNTKVAASGSNTYTLGPVFRLKAGSSFAIGSVLFLDAATTDKMFFSDNGSLAGKEFLKTNGSTIDAGSDAWAFGPINIPIANWGSSVVMADRAVEEFGWTSGAFDSTSSTTAYGAGGQAITSLAADRVKTITWQNPIQASDRIVVEGSRDGVTWGDMNGFSFSGGNVVSAMDSAGNQAGFSHYSSGSTTVVTFYVRMNVANDDSPGPTWPSSAAYWRVRKTAGGASVGYPISSENISAPLSPSQLILSGGNGQGSTNTMIRRFTSAIVNTGSDITYADSSTLGGTITINRAGVYAISYSDAMTAGPADMGISKNSTQLTTKLNSITDTDIVIGAKWPSSGGMHVGATIRCAAGDVLRAHGDTGLSLGTAGYNVRLVVTRVGP